MIRIINNRPIVFLTFFFVLGIAFGYYLKISVEVFILCTIISCSIGLPLFFCKKHIVVGIYLIMFFVGGLLFIKDYNTDFSGINLGEPQSIEGKVTNKDKTKSGFNKYTLSSVEVEGKKFNKNVLLYSKQGFEYGDILSYESKISMPKQQENPDVFDEKIYLASQNVGFSTFNENIIKTGEGFAFLKYPNMLRQKFADNIDYMYTQETSPIAKAMFLGMKSEIDEDVREDFSVTGGAHVLAISGLHIGIVAFILNFILKKFKMSRYLRFSINIVCLLAYMTITGLAPSVVRAVIMFIFIIIGRWFYTKRDILTYLALSMLLTLMFNTVQLFTAGFLMSYGAVFGILCLYPPLERFFDKKHLDKVKLSKSLSASISASATTIPLTAYYFKGVSFASPITNFLVIPFATLIVVFTGLSCIISLFFMQIAKFFAYFSQIFIVILLEFNKLVASVKFGYAEIYNMTVMAAVMCYFAIYILSDYVFIIKWQKILIVIICIVLIMCSFGINTQNDLQFTVLDVGKGDAIHIKTSEKNILIDNGQNARSSNMYAYTKGNNIFYDFIVVSNDRTKNLKAIINEGYTNTLYVPKNYISKEYDENLSVNYYEDKNIIIDESTYLDIVGNNNKNYSFLLYYNERPICLFAQNKDININIQTDIIKLADGGKENSLSEELLNTINPKYAIISLKKNDVPHVDTLKSLEERNIKIYRTDINNAITVNIDNNNINIYTMRE